MFADSHTASTQHKLSANGYESQPVDRRSFAGWHGAQAMASAPMALGNRHELA
jgi:hypothetical protein